MLFSYAVLRSSAGLSFVLSLLPCSSLTPGFVPLRLREPRRRDVTVGSNGSCSLVVLGREERRFTIFVTKLSKGVWRCVLALAGLDILLICLKRDGTSTIIDDRSAGENNEHPAIRVTYSCVKNMYYYHWKFYRRDSNQVSRYSFLNELREMNRSLFSRLFD